MGKGSIGLVVVTTVLTIIAGVVNIWYVKEKSKQNLYLMG